MFGGGVSAGRGVGTGVAYANIAIVQDFVVPLHSTHVQRPRRPPELAHPLAVRAPRGSESVWGVQPKSLRTPWRGPRGMREGQ